MFSSPSSPSSTERAKYWLPVAAFLALFAVIITRRAWLSDDAYITFRTVDNLVRGYGPVWNLGERVQAFTHPLWMLLVSFFYFFTREIYFTSVFLSLGVSLAAVGLLAGKVARNTFGALLGVAILGLSNAYVDYSTSGLENPLTNLLLIGFLALFFGERRDRRHLFWLSLLAGLGAVNRADTLLLYLPALAFAWWQTPDRKRGLVAVILGLSPIIAWEIFSVVYYGFPFPNTAYSKLNQGISAGELATQGFFYYLSSLQRDPITLTVIFGGLVLAAFTRSWKNWAVALGTLFYLAYIVKIGGDFMGGRYFTAPLLAMVAVFTAREYEFATIKDSRWIQPALMGAVLAVGLIAPLPTYRIDQPASLSDEKRINDERAWYFEQAALINRSRYEPFPPERGYYNGLAARALSEVDYVVEPQNNVGMFGYYAGPNVYIIDEYGLGDPLMARLPPEREQNFFIGHFHRRVPYGYIESIYSHKNLIKDASLAKYYDQLHLIVSGKLFAPERLLAIWKMNTGQLNDLIPFDAYRYPDLATSTLKRQNEQGETLSFVESGAEVALGEIHHEGKVKLTVGSNAEFQVEFRKEGKTVAEVTLESYLPGDAEEYTMNVPVEAARAGYDTLRVMPMRGKAPYLLRTVRLQP